MIIIDVDLSARPKIGVSISETVDLTGALGTTHGGATLSETVDLSGTLTGGREAMAGVISQTVGLDATPIKLWMQSIPTNYGFDIDGYYDQPWPWVVRTRALEGEDAYGDTVVGMSMSATSTLSVSPSYSIALPSPPAPAPPEDPENPGTFPMPQYGGITVRALAGIAVSVDAPVIQDGRPT